MLKMNHYLLAGTALAFAVGVSAPVALHAQQNAPQGSSATQSNKMQSQSGQASPGSRGDTGAGSSASQPAMNNQQTGVPSAAGGTAQGSSGSTTSAGQSQAGQGTAANQQVAAQGSKLVGKELYGANNEKVGEVDNVLMGPNNQANSVLVDIGGFLGMGAKTVAIPVSQLRAEGDRLVAQNLTKEQARNMQEYKEGDSTTGQKRM